MILVNPPENFYASNVYKACLKERGIKYRFGKVVPDWASYPIKEDLTEKEKQEIQQLLKGGLIQKKSRKRKSK